jgi:hypothetical protein
MAMVGNILDYFMFLDRYTVTLCIFGTIIISFATMGSLVYQFDTYTLPPGTKEYLGSFSDTFWTIFVSVSTAGLPNQMVPYYTDQRESFFYFFVYLSFGTIIMLNLILVVVMAGYEAGLQIIREQKARNRRRNLNEAFSILDVDHKGYLTYRQVYVLLEETFATYPEFRSSVFKVPSVIGLNFLVAALDVNGDGCFITEDLK